MSEENKEPLWSWNLLS